LTILHISALFLLGVYMMHSYASILLHCAGELEKQASESRRAGAMVEVDEGAR
jgi:hypothetical protein